MKRSEMLASLPILGVMVVGDGPTRTEQLERETARDTQAEAKEKPGESKRWVIVHVADGSRALPRPWWHLAGDKCGMCDGVGVPAIAWYDGELPHGGA